MLFAVLSAYLAFVQGDVQVVHQGQTLVATVNMPLVEGDRVRTVNGRAQVQFPDGTSLDVDPYTEIEFLTATRVRVVSSLPPEIEPYAGALAGYGTWQEVAPYGHVWCPRVDASWRPYTNGHWKGLLWIGADPFAWPTHHYGRWAYDHGRWMWIPTGTPDLHRVHGTGAPHGKPSPVMGRQSTVDTPQPTLLSPQSSVDSPQSTIVVPAATVAVPRTVMAPPELRAPRQAPVVTRPPTAVPAPMAAPPATTPLQPLQPRQPLTAAPAPAPPQPATPAVAPAPAPAPPPAPPKRASAGSAGKSAPKRQGS